MIFCRQIFFVSLLELDMLVREKKDVHIVGNTHDVILLTGICTCKDDEEHLGNSWKPTY